MVHNIYAYCAIEIVPLQPVLHRDGSLLQHRQDGGGGDGGVVWYEGSGKPSYSQIHLPHYKLTLKILKYLDKG